MKWKTRVERAAKRGRFTKKDKIDAENWDSCAIGERKHLSLTGDELDLGIRFWRYVKEDNMFRASIVLELIEALPA